MITHQAFENRPVLTLDCLPLRVSKVMLCCRTGVVHRERPLSDLATVCLRPVPAVHINEMMQQSGRCNSADELLFRAKAHRLKRKDHEAFESC